MKHVYFLILSLCIALIHSFAADPMSTSYSYEECQGSLMPYPTNIKSVATPDSLTVVMLNHVGRHGARFPASSTHSMTLYDALERAELAGTITKLGKDLMPILSYAIAMSDGQWGALDSLGMEEQRGIASRMHAAFPSLFDNTKVMAYSSYSPRCMMSMYYFTHQLDRLNNHTEFFTSTGRQNDKMLRPFDIDQDYINFRKSNSVPSVYDEYFENTCPLTAINRILGDEFPYKDLTEQRNLAIVEYYVLAGFAAMQVDCDLKMYFTKEEINALWSCFNLRQYLQRTSTTLSSIPAEIASDLLLDLIDSIDKAIENDSPYSVILRFGHAETLMPLLSLMKVPGCYYLTNYFDTVSQHWRDFYVVPMASNIQLILFKNIKNQYFVRLDLNENPVAFIPNNNNIYVPWKDARQYLMRCVPLYAQP